MAKPTNTIDTRNLDNENSTEHKTGGKGEEIPPKISPS